MSYISAESDTFHRRILSASNRAYASAFWLFSSGQDGDDGMLRLSAGEFIAVCT